MAGKLTDKQRKKIIAERAEGKSLRELARKYGVSDATIRRTVNADPEMSQKVAHKKRACEESILAHMEAKRDVVNEIITNGLTALADPEKMRAARPDHITTALGTLIDKFVPIETGKKGAAGKAYELPARVIGKAYCDINRQIEPNKTYVFAGGRGSLKSSYISLKIIELLKNHPTMHACVVRKVGNTLRDSVFAQMKWAIHELGLDEEFETKVSPLEISHKTTGQVIFFRGCDDPYKLKSIKPPFGYIGILWKEEKDQLAGPEEERSVNQSILRGGPLSYDFSSYNPPKTRMNWVNMAELEDNPNRILHRSTYLDAPPEWLGQKFLDDAEHLRAANPDAYEHEYEGKANGNGGNVFENLEIRTITDKEIASFDRIFQGADWGWYPDPFAFIRLHYDKARETIYLIDEIYANKLPNEQSAAEIKRRKYTDAYITCDNAEPKSVADYRACGLPAKEAKKGPGSVEYGMKWLQKRKIVIDQKRTPNAYKEFANYEYERTKDGEIISGYPDADNHLIDATRYALERVFNRFGSNA